MRAYYCEPAAGLLFFPQDPCSVASEMGGGVGRGKGKRERKEEEEERREREGGREIQAERNYEGSCSGRSASSMAEGGMFSLSGEWGGEVVEANADDDAGANSQSQLQSFLFSTGTGTCSSYFCKRGSKTASVFK